MNTVMANVKVAVRVRPLSKREEENDAVSVVNVHNETLLSITNWKIGGTDEGDRHRERVKYFSFDYVFNSSDKWDESYASQEQVYQQLGPEVISAACDGYNTCLFAYGQTSSGKTHTMVGTQADCGLIPRISEGLFKSVTQLNEDVTYKFEISFLEIYNEKVRDLLAPLGNAKFPLKVREHAKDGPYVPDLSRHIVSDYKQVVKLLEQGMVSRTTASTHMHEFSSRSHAIFTIHFVQAKMEQQLPSEIVSKINLVDLAGSERANLNFSKDRLQEGANINKSLVMLGNCISALAENALSAISMESLANDDTDLRSSQGLGSRSAGFVPYRNSVLTWLLKDSLGGNAKTIMIATISPASIHYNETMSTLRYARRATHIVNQPIINEDPHVRLIRELRGEIHRLKNLLCSASLGSSSTSLCQDYSINQMLQENEVRVDQLTEAWVDKWKDVALIMQECNVGIRRQSVGVVVESDIPHLIGLDDDLSNGIVLYHLQNGCTRIGRDDAITTQDIVLNSSVDVETEHAVITNEDDVVMFYPMGDAACTINGEDVHEPVQLKQGAVILLGKTNMFRFNHPAQAARMREKRAIDKFGVTRSFQHGNVALAAASQGGASPVGSSTDGTWSPDDTEAVLEQMSLLLSPRSPHDLKEGHFFDSNEFDSFGEEEVVDSEQCIMGDNQEELVERQRLVLCGLKKEHALAMIKAEEELKEMQRKVEEEKDKGASKLQQEIENYRQHRKTVSSSNGLADESALPKFVDLESIQVKQADVECKQLTQIELILRHSERKAVANLGRKRAAIDVQRMSTELEIEEEEKRLHEMEMLVSYTPPSERLSSVSSDSSSNGVEEKNKNSKEKNRSKESTKIISNGKVKDTRPRRENARSTLSDKHKRSSSLSQKENTKKVLPNRTRSRSASISSTKSSDSKTAESNGTSKSGSSVFSRLYPQNKPKFDYLKKKDHMQYDDVAAKQSSQWERGKLMRREVSPLKGETLPGKSNIERQNLKHSYKPKSYENGLSVNPKSSKYGPPKHSGLSSTMPRTKSQSNPGLSRTKPGPKKDMNSIKKGSTQPKEKGKKKPLVISRTSSLPDVSCVGVGKLRLRAKMQSTPDLPKKILKKGDRKAAVWQDVKGSPQRLKPEMTRLRSGSDVSTLSSTSSFPKETSGRRRCSVGLWTSVDLLPIQKSSSQAYFLPWNSEKCVSLENLCSDAMPQSMAPRQRSLSMIDLPSNARENSIENIPVNGKSLEREDGQPEIVVMEVSGPNKGVGEGLPLSELLDDCAQDRDEEEKGEASSETSSSDLSEEDSLEEDFRDEDDLNEDTSLLKEDDGVKKEEKDGQIILENGEKNLPVEQKTESFPEDEEELSPSDHSERQNDGIMQGKDDDENIEGDKTLTPHNLEDARMLSDIESQNEGTNAVSLSDNNPDRTQTGSNSEICPVNTIEEHEIDIGSLSDDLSSCDESVVSDATYSLPAPESQFNKEMDGEDLSNSGSTPVIPLKEGIPHDKEGNPALDGDKEEENGEIETVDDDSDSAIGHCGVERNNILREAGCQTCPVDGVVLHGNNAQESSSDDSSSFGDSASPDSSSTLPKFRLLTKENDFDSFGGQNGRTPVLLSESGDEQEKTFCEAGCQTTPVDDENRGDDYGDLRSKDVLSFPEGSTSPSDLTNLTMASFTDKSESKEKGDEKLDEGLVKNNDGKNLLTENSCQTYPQDDLGLNGTHGVQSPCGNPSSMDGGGVYGDATKPNTHTWECDKETPNENIADFKPDEMSNHPTLNGEVNIVTEVACQTYPLDGVELNGIGELEPSNVKAILFPRYWPSCIPDPKEVIENDELIPQNGKLPTSREISCQTVPVESFHLNGLDSIEPPKGMNQELDDLNFADLYIGKNMVEPVLACSLNGLPSTSVASSPSSTDEENEEEEDETHENGSVNNGINLSDYDRNIPPEVTIIPKDTTVFETYIETDKDTDSLEGDWGMVGDRKKGKVVTFSSPLVTVCDDDVGSQSETLSETDQFDFGNEDCHEENGVDEVRGEDKHLQDNSKDNPLLEYYEENPSASVMGGWESSVLGMENQDWEICDDTGENIESLETSVGVKLDVKIDSPGDEDSSKMEDCGNVMEEEDARDLPSEKPDKGGEGYNHHLDLEMRDGPGEEPRGIIEDTDSTNDGLIQMYGENDNGGAAFEKGSDGENDDGGAAFEKGSDGEIDDGGAAFEKGSDGENDGGAAFEKGTVCQKCQRKGEVDVGELGFAEEDIWEWCSECGNKEPEQESDRADRADRVDSVDVNAVEQLPDALQPKDECNQSCSEDARDNSLSSLQGVVMISYQDSNCNVEPEKDCELPSRPADQPADFVFHQPAMHGSPECSTWSQESGVVDGEPEHVNITEVGDVDVIEDKCDIIGLVQDRCLDGEDIILEFGNDNVPVNSSTVDSDGDNDKDRDTSIKDASFSDYDETDDDETESSGESDEMDVDSFKKNIMQVGVVFSQGKRYIIDGDEIFDPFALSPIKEERGGSDPPLSLITSVDDFQLPLSEEEGDVALYQKGKVEMAEGEIMEPGFYSDESDEDEMYHEKELPDENVMDNGEGEWCPPRVEVALIKDVFTAEQDLPSDLVKSPDVEYFMLQQEDSSDEDLTFGELAPHDLLGSNGACGSDAMSLTSPETLKRKTKFLMSLNVNTSPTTTATSDGHFGISPAANYRKPPKISISPQEARFSMASPCSSPESPQRKFMRGNHIRDSGSDTDVSEGETTANVRGEGNVRQRKNKPSAYSSRDVRRNVVRASHAKLSKSVQFQENKDVVVRQVFSVEEETQTESGVCVESMVQSYVYDPQDDRDSSEEEEELDKNRRVVQQKVRKNTYKEARLNAITTKDSRSKSLPSRQEAEQAKPMVASYTQTSPMVSPGGVTMSSGKGSIQRPSKLHLLPKEGVPCSHHVSGGKKQSYGQSPPSNFRWDLFPSATTFQPPELRRTQSLPTQFDNPLLVSPRKGSSDTPSSDSGDRDLRLGLSSQEEGSGDDTPVDPFSQLITSLEHCQLSINTSSRVRKLCDDLQMSTLPEMESAPSPLMELKVLVSDEDEEEPKTDKEPQNTTVMQVGREKDKTLHQFDSRWRQSPSDNLCAMCHNCIHHCGGTENEGYTLRSGGDVPELLLVGEGKWHQQQHRLRDETLGFMSPIWEPVHKEAVSITCQEDFFCRVSDLVEKPQKEQNHDQVSLEGRKNATQPLKDITSSSGSYGGDLRDLANKLSISQSRMRPVSQDVEELVPQRVQMPAFSDISFDSEFAEHEFFSDEEGDGGVNLKGKKRDGAMKDEHGEDTDEEGEAGEDGDIDPNLWDDVIEPELTALMSNSTNTPVNQPSEHGVSSGSQAKTSGPLKGDIGRSETLGGLGNFAADIPAHRIKDHSNDYVLSVNINIPPFPHRVEQRWNPPSYDANLQCNWSDAPELGNASNVSRGSEMLDKKGQNDVWMSHLTASNTRRAQDGIVNGPKRFPSESSESQLTASSGVFTSSIQTSADVSSPTKLSESLSPTDSVLAEDEDMISVQNELQDFLAKNLTGNEMAPTFSGGYERVETSTPEGVGTQVGSSELDLSWTSPELDSLRSERQMVRRLSNSWDRSDLAVELMEARIMHGIGETDAFLRFLDNDVPLEEWLRTKTDLDMKLDEEKREILALEKNDAIKTGYSGKVARPSSVHCKGWSPKRRTPPSKHLKFLQGLRKDLVSNAPPSFLDTKNEIEALLQEYKELHRNSESEIAQAQKELDGVRVASRVPSVTEKEPPVDMGGSKKSDSDEDLIDKEIQSLHAATIAMSMSDSPGSDASSHHRFDFSGVSSDDDRISDDTIRERGKYSRLNGDLSESLKLVKTPSKKSLKEKLEDAERQVSNERQLRRREEQCRQSLMQSSGEWSESECSVLIGQTFQILLQETASFQGVQQHSVEGSQECGGWRVLSEMQGIFIFEKCVVDTSCRRYLGLEIIKAPASCVFNHLRKPINLQGVFGKCLKKLSVLQRLEKGKFILHLTFNTRQCGLHYPRAVTCIFLAEQRKNVFVVGATSVKQQKLQVQKTIPAIVLHFGFCLDPFYIDGMEHCRVTLLSQIDLKDCLEADMLQTISQKLLSRVLGNLKGLVEVGQL